MLASILYNLYFYTSETKIILTCIVDEFMNNA